MSALGQKRTFAVRKGMSASPPKADVGAAQINVCCAQKQFQNARTEGTGRCVVRSRGALPLFQPTASLFRIRSSLVAQWNRNAGKLVQIWLSWGLLLFVFDRHGLRMAARRAFKGSPVMVGLIGWLDARKKHRHSAHIAGWRQITWLQRIREMRLRHDEAPTTRYRRERHFCLSATDA